jgi:hypothetical protein
MIIMCFGVCSFSFAVGSLSSILTSLDAKTAKLKEKLGILDEIRKDYNIDTELYLQLRKALRYDYRKNDVDKYEFINQLPPHLQDSLSLIMNHELIGQFEFFKNKPNKFVAYISEILKPIKILKGKYIYKKNDTADYIYFMVKGKAAIALPKLKDAPFLEFAPVQ